MRIILAEAPFSYDESIVKGQRYFPLGIGYIASYIRQKPNRDVHLFVDNLEEFQNLIQAQPPDVLGLSAMTSSYPTCAKMARMAKAVNPRCLVMLGGQHATSVGARVFSEVPEIDFVAMGEGEQLMDRFLDELETGRQEWKGVPGLIYRTEGTYISVPQAGLLKGLDDLPFPARDLLSLDHFTSHAHMRFGTKTASLVSSRGCPWKCSYCSSFVTMGRQFRKRSPSNVVDEMEQMNQTWGIDNFIFWDDVFTVVHDRVFEFCNELKRRRLDVTWWCMSRTDRMTQELTNAMADAGCVMISFGIESGSENTLKRIRKQVDLQVVTEAIAYTRAAGIRTQGTFILGLPFETRDDLRTTVNFAKSCGVDIALFFSFTPYPGTEEWDYVPEPLKPKAVDEWHSFVCNTRQSRSWNPRFSDAELGRIIGKAHRDFYFRPGQIWRIGRTIRSVGEFKAYVESALSLTWSVMRPGTILRDDAVGSEAL
jgi:anaerobic magnesium-protoporphyrin IX monomethyl ester cyclase